jgi:hypothetical protein
MSLEEFKSYLYNRGINFDELTNDKKIEYGEAFDRSRQVQPAGKLSFKNNILTHQ